MKLLDININTFPNAHGDSFHKRLRKQFQIINDNFAELSGGGTNSIGLWTEDTQPDGYYYPLWYKPSTGEFFVYSNGSFTKPVGNIGEPGPQGTSIVSIEKTGTVGLVDTYTISLSNGLTTFFTVRNGSAGTNGVGITNIDKLSGNGNPGTTDTYRIYLSDSSSYDFTVYNGANGTNGTDGTNGTNGTNGADGVSITSIQKTAGNSAPGTTDTYTITLSNGQTSTFTVYNGKDGTNALDDFPRNITNALNGDILTFNSGAWINQPRTVITDGGNF